MIGYMGRLIIEHDENYGFKMQLKVLFLFILMGLGLYLKGRKLEFKAALKLRKLDLEYSINRLPILTLYNVDKENTKLIYALLYNKIKPIAAKYSDKFDIPIDKLTKAVVSQAVLESGWFKSKLAVKHNNLFGHKPRTKDKKVYVKSFEYIKGKRYDYKMNFRAYKSLEASIVHHFDSFLLKERYETVRKATNVKDFFNELYKSGYATDPNYSDKLYRLYLKYGG